MPFSTGFKNCITQSSKRERKRATGSRFCTTDKYFCFSGLRPNPYYWRIANFLSFSFFLNLFFILFLNISVIKLVRSTQKTAYNSAGFRHLLIGIRFLTIVFCPLKSGHECLFSTKHTYIVMPSFKMAKCEKCSF